MSDLIRLGLIGDNIARSQSPKLHRLAGRLTGRTVTYDLLVPADLGAEFDTVFECCATDGYQGINVTYPYKERAAGKVSIDDPLVRAIGAVNTVVFEEAGPRGHNTDHTGFIAAYWSVRGDVPPGSTCLVGAGGVGRAIAFGLVALGAAEIRIVDREASKAETLGAALRSARPDLVVRTGTDAEAMAAGAEGLVNATPVGMVGYPGSALPRGAMAGAGWAFDAVYTPVDTTFLADAEAEGLQVISGYELFFGQGVDAWAIFTGIPIDQDRLREALRQPE